MQDKLINRRDLDFLLYELLDVESLTRSPRYAEHSRDTFGAAIDTALRIAADEFAPHHRQGDTNEPRVVGERVTLIPEVKRALAAYADAGFIAAGFGCEDGGMQLPHTVATACWSLFKAANIATDTYGSLAIGVANMLAAYGTAQQKARYLKPLLTGRFLGTMVLTEPHAGSSLAEIKTAATPRDDGRYAIKGSKIFITAGDHELSENIVHLVLARIPGAPAGVKGISLFIVPKYRVDGAFQTDPHLGPPPEGKGVHGGGTPRIRNDVSLTGLIHKMGSRGATSAMLNFGERGECIGELLGEANGGLACMFRMMNEARINVGVASSMLAYTGYLHALSYARERVQGRATPDPRSPQVPIVRHADVRRMLLAQKCIAEGALALCLYGAWLTDRRDTAQTEGERRQAHLLLDLLTPVIKAWPAAHGTHANSLAIQVHGGHGYTRDHPVEQFYRDNRLNSIHEGTDGIQALDLLGRKVGASGAAGLALLGVEIERTLDAARALDDSALAQHAEQLASTWRDLVETTRVLLAALPRRPNVALAHASTYLDAFGHTVIAWMWLRQAVLATPHAGGCESNFYRGKLAAAHHFFHCELPKTGPQHALLRSLDPSLVELDDAWL